MEQWRPLAKTTNGRRVGKRRVDARLWQVARGAYSAGRLSTRSRSALPPQSWLVVQRSCASLSDVRRVAPTNVAARK